MKNYYDQKFSQREIITIFYTYIDPDRNKIINFFSRWEKTRDCFQSVKGFEIQTFNSKWKLRSRRYLQYVSTFKKKLCTFLYLFNISFLL